jgi:hypothetical protein
VSPCVVWDVFTPLGMCVVSSLRSCVFIDSIFISPLTLMVADVLWLLWVKNAGESESCPHAEIVFADSAIVLKNEGE